MSASENLAKWIRDAIVYAATGKRPTKRPQSKVGWVIKWGLITTLALAGWATIQENSITPAQRAEKQKLAAEEERRAHTPEGLAMAVYTKRRKPQVLQLEKSFVQVTVDDESYLTAGWLHDVAQHQATEFLSKVFDANPDVQKVLIINRATLTDVRGHTSLDPVMRVTMTRKTAASINWGNFRSGNLDRVADEYWEHRAFSSD